MGEVPTLKFLSQVSCIQVLLELTDYDRNVFDSKKMLRYISTGYFSAVTEGLLQRIVDYFPDKLSDAFLQNLAPEHIRKLNLSKCVALSPLKTIHTLRKCRKLQKLDLSHCKMLVLPQVFEVLGLVLNQLTHLSIEGCETATDDVIKSILRSLKHLQHFNMSECPNVTENVFDVDQFRNVGKDMEMKCSLVSIDLSCCGITNRSVQNLMKLTGQTLKHINVALTQVTPLLFLCLSGLELPEAVFSVDDNDAVLEQLTKLLMAEMSRCDTGHVEQQMLVNPDKSSIKGNLSVESETLGEDCGEIILDINDLDFPPDEENRANDYREGDGCVACVEILDQGGQCASVTETAHRFEDEGKESMARKPFSEIAIGQDCFQTKGFTQSADVETKPLISSERLVGVNEVIIPDALENKETPEPSDASALNSKGVEDINVIDDQGNKVSQGKCNNQRSGNNDTAIITSNSTENHFDNCNTVCNQEEKSSLKHCNKSETVLDQSEAFGACDLDSVCVTNLLENNCENGGVCDKRTIPDQDVVLSSDKELANHIQPCVNNYANNFSNTSLQFCPIEEIDALNLAEETLDLCDIQADIKETVFSISDDECKVPVDKMPCKTTSSDVNIKYVWSYDDPDTLTVEEMVLNEDENMFIEDQEVLPAEEKVSNVDERVLNEDDKMLNAEDKMLTRNQKVLEEEQKVLNAQKKELKGNKVLDGELKMKSLEEFSDLQENVSHSEEIVTLVENNEKNSNNSVCITSASELETKEERSCMQTDMKISVLFKPHFISVEIGDFRYRHLDFFRLCFQFFILKNKNLQKFGISWSEFDDTCLNYVSENLEDLREVSLVGCQMLTTGGILKLGGECKKLQKVNLQGVSFICDLSIMPFMKTGNLRTLNLAECNITDLVLIRLASTSLPTMQKLDLSWCEDLTQRGINVLCSKESSLQSLSLRQLPASNLTLALIAKNLVFLREINLSSVEQITNEAVVDMAKNLTLLESVDVSWNTGVYDDGVHALLLYCPNIRTLVLSGLKLLTSSPFMHLIADLKQWNRCKSLFKLKHQEYKAAKVSNEDHLSSDEEYEDLCVPYRSTVFAANLKSLSLEYCDSIDDIKMQEVVAVCRGSLKVIDYYSEVVEPILFKLPNKSK